MATSMPDQTLSKTSPVLGGELRRFELRPDFSRNPGAEVRLAERSRILAKSFCSQLDVFAQQNGSTPCQLHLAAFATLLARYSGETSIVLGIGANDESLSLDLSGNPTFHELLQRAGEAEGATSLQDLHFHIVGLHVSAEQLAGSVLLSCDFDHQLFRVETIDRLLHHLELLLGEILHRPGRKLAEYSFLTADERKRLLVDWNATSADYPRDLSLPQLLGRRTAQAGESVAIGFGEQKLSYAELDGRVDHLAHYLAQLGAGPGAVIGILVDRSPEMIVALLAVLKTGAAYLPLDPAFPAARLEFMAGDTEIAGLITTSTLAGTLAKRTGSGVFTVLLDTIPLDQPSSVPVPAFERQIDPESLAYILYTSGSTGKPKGVELQHRAVVNLLCAMQAHVQLRPGDSLLAVTTLSFDIAGLELLLPLMTGSRIELASQAQASDPLLLRDLLQKIQPALMQGTPTCWRMLIDAGWNGSETLKILVGGEQITRQIADALLDRGSAVWNCYGPTETTIWSTISRLERDSRPVTIGRPLANTTLYVLDAYGQLLPQGAAGELYIGGDGVARGYLKRPDLNAERFIPNPFGPGRLYRTGDIVRYQPDGRLEILGRNDCQVKVRGFRIEPGEIEAALSACPQVRAAAVVVRTPASGESVLAGYFVPGPGAEVQAIRTWLANRIPDYMVPTFLLPMPELPATLNGKIDRNALPDPETERGTPEPALDPLEATLIAIWEAVLKVRPVGRTQNFFDLGGHSILAAKVFALMEKKLGTALPLAALFHAPTVEKLADVIRKSNWKPLWSSLVAIRPAGTKSPFFIVHPIGGNVLNFAGFCGHFGPDRPIYGLQARGLNNEEAPHTSIQEMASDYVCSIRSVQPEGPYLIGGFSAGGVVAFEMAQQLRAAGQQVATLALLDTEAPLLPQAEGPSVVRATDWVRTFKLNLYYASRMRLKEFLIRKAINFRTRTRLMMWNMRERRGTQPARLTAEEGFLLAMKRYVPRPYAGNAILFCAGDAFRNPPPRVAWQGLIEGDLDIHPISGDHDTILQEPHIGVLARLLESCIETTSLRDAENPGAAVSSDRIPLSTSASGVGTLKNHLPDFTEFQHESQMR